MKMIPLPECSLVDATAIWNRGYEGYYSPVRFTVDQFTARFGRDGLSAEHSLVAYQGGRPMGIMVNGIDTIGSTMVAWNGGTAVVPEARGQGIGRALMEAAIALYRREHVQVATLEAFEVNEPAIRLYESMGYQITDRLLFLKHDGKLPGESFTQGLAGTAGYVVSACSPHQVGSLPFYRAQSPWQSQWMHIHQGSAIMVRDALGNPAGYALYKSVVDATGRPSSIILYQCEHHPAVPDPDFLLSLLLQAVYSPYDAPCVRMTFNFPADNGRTLRLLEANGFAPAATATSIPLTQVFMKRTLDDSP